MLFILALEIKTNRALPYDEQGPRFDSSTTRRGESTKVYIDVKKRSVAGNGSRSLLPGSYLRRELFGVDGG